MNNAFTRTEILIGKTHMNILKKSTVAIFGIGGVGSFVAEALARAGVGNLTLIDYDHIDVTNINRQIHANIDTIGLPKVEVMKERLLKINPELNITIHQEFFAKTKCNSLILDSYDYIVDAIDSVDSKLDLIENSIKKNIKIISAMGARK